MSSDVFIWYYVLCWRAGNNQPGRMVVGQTFTIGKYQSWILVIDRNSCPWRCINLAFLESLFYSFCRWELVTLLLFEDVWRRIGGSSCQSQACTWRPRALKLHHFVSDGLTTLWLHLFSVFTKRVFTFELSRNKHASDHWLWLCRANADNGEHKGCHVEW